MLESQSSRDHRRAGPGSCESFGEGMARHCNEMHPGSRVAVDCPDALLHPAFSRRRNAPRLTGTDLVDVMRTAVVGVGYLGRFHAQKYHGLPNSDLVGIADPSASARAAVAAELGVAAHADYRELLGRVDAVSVVTPTPSHYAIAKEFLEAGAHVLLEKPMTTTVAEGEGLIEAARRAKRILQIGHLERFNAAVQAVQPILTVPRFIESARLAPFKHRGTDVDVVLDLMIHDIDLILSIVRSAVVAVDAIGSSVFSGEIDIANARLRFANGCVANATASRVSLKTERRLRLFQDDAYVSVDLHQKLLTVIRKTDGMSADGLPKVNIEETGYEQGDALKAEIEAFLQAAATGQPPPVTGEDGLKALRTALLIAEQVANSRAGFSVAPA
jgi:predicted dehydrogenase